MTGKSAEVIYKIYKNELSVKFELMFKDNPRIKFLAYLMHMIVHYSERDGYNEKFFQKSYVKIYLIY